MSKTGTNAGETRRRILEAVLPLFNERGLKFTMDELARRLGMSKKTIYAVFPDKETLLHAMVDHCFDFIREGKDRLIRDADLDEVQKLRQVLSLLTEKYEGIDLHKLHVLRQRYPAVYDHVAQRLEGGWESTVTLLERGMADGTLRPVPIPLFKTMMEATLEQFFQQDVLVRSGLTYRQGLEQVVDILLEGILLHPEGERT